MFVVMESKWNGEFEVEAPVFANESEKTCQKYIDNHGGESFNKKFPNGTYCSYSRFITEVEDEL